MIILEAAIPDVLILQPEIHGDDRGFFMETFRLSHFRDQGVEAEFVQDNQSRSDTFRLLPNFGARRTTKLKTGKITLRGIEITVFERIPVLEQIEMIKDCEECSICLMPFTDEQDLENSKLRIVRSQIEYVN